MSRAATSRIKCNPVLGSPPTLEWRAVSELLIDPTYQREINTAPSQTLIRKIAQFWDWGLCQPLAISRRPDGKLTIVDGQHRASAAQLRGDIPHLPCVITSYANTGDEAAAFVALNQMRRPLSKLDLFRAAVAAEDKDALLIVECVEAAGLRIASSTNLVNAKPGAISNIGGLQRVLTRDGGENVLRVALAALAQGFSGQALQYAGTIFPGLAAVGKDELRLRTPLAEIVPALARIAATKSQDDWRREIKAAIGESGGMAREASEMLFRRYWRISRGIIEPPSAPKPSVPAPQPCRSLRSDLSFEEQIALVESGKAKVVDKIIPHAATPDHTLGGVTGEII
jgi:hypothetical protein